MKNVFSLFVLSSIFMIVLAISLISSGNIIGIITGSLFLVLFAGAYANLARIYQRLREDSGLDFKIDGETYRTVLHYNNVMYHYFNDEPTAGNYPESEVIRNAYVHKINQDKQLLELFVSTPSFLLPKHLVEVKNLLKEDLWKIK